MEEPPTEAKSCSQFLQIFGVYVDLPNTHVDSLHTRPAFGAERHWYGYAGGLEVEDKDDHGVFFEGDWVNKILLSLLPGLRLSSMIQANDRGEVLQKRQEFMMLSPNRPCVHL